MLLIISLLLVGCFLFIIQDKKREFVSSKPPYTHKMPEVFSSAYFGLFQNHDQIINLFDKVKGMGKLDDTPKILINFDLHSDIQYSPTADTNIGNWMNAFLAKKNSQGKHLIDEVYWVLPEETSSGPQKDYYWNPIFSTKRDMTLNGPVDQIYYENSSGKIVNDGHTPPASYPIIKLHKRLLHQLPSFKDLRKEIIISFDADYFIYDSFYLLYSVSDTNPDTYPNTHTPTEIENILNNTVESLYNLGIKPILVAASQSPGFNVENLVPTINKFFFYVSTYSKLNVSIHN